MRWAIIMWGLAYGVAGIASSCGDKPWMGCGGDGAVGIGIGAGILLWGAMGGWWGVRVGDGVRFLLFYSGLALTCPWRGVLWALLGRGGVVGWAGNFGWALSWALFCFFP